MPQDIKVEKVVLIKIVFHSSQSHDACVAYTQKQILANFVSLF